MDNTPTENKTETTGRGGLAAPVKGKTKTFLIGKKLKTTDLCHTAAVQGNRDSNKIPPKTPDSRRGASQAAGAAPTLRYGPAGDSAPLRLKAAGMAERFLPARPHGPNAPFSLVNSHPFGSARSSPGREAAKEDP